MERDKVMNVGIVSCKPNEQAPQSVSRPEKTYRLLRATPVAFAFVFVSYWSFANFANDDLDEDHLPFWPLLVTPVTPRHPWISRGEWRGNHTSLKLRKQRKAEGDTRSKDATGRSWLLAILLGTRTLLGAEQEATRGSWN